MGSCRLRRTLGLYKRMSRLAAGSAILLVDSKERKLAQEKGC